MALNQAATALEIAAPLVDTIPIVGPRLRAALEAAARIAKYANDVKSNKEKIKELAEHAATWCTTIMEALSGRDRDDEELSHLLEQLERVVEALREIEEWSARRLKEPLIQRMWNKSQDTEKIIKLDQRLKHAFDQFMFASQVAIRRNVADLISDADKSKLEFLGFVPAARYDSLESPSGCLPNTRNDVIDRMLNWTTQTVHKLSIYWLAGLAGTGKSTIAKTFCERVASLSTVWVVTFFASKSSAERRNPFRMLYTFAYELAHLNPSIRKHVLFAIRSHPDIRQRLMREQVECLIARPYAAAHRAGTTRPLVIVIDALDECAMVHGVEGGSLVQDLAHALKEFPVKLVVTSRVETPIRGVFEALPEKTSRFLHDIDLSEVSADVRRVLEMKFKDINLNHHITTQPWPSDDAIHLLTQRTGHLFIFATTVLQYVGDREVRRPETRLRQVLENTTMTSTAYPYAEIDMLYMHILRHAAHDARGQINNIISQRMRLVLGAICILQEPQAVPGLATLLQMSGSDIERDVEALAAVLLHEKGGTSPEAKRAVRIFHPSFRDFLTDSARCKDDRFFVEITRQHQDLSVHCLDLLNSGLKRDIREIRNVTVHNSQVDNPPLAARLHQYVPDALRYACCFWPEHLSSSNLVPSPSLISALQTFIHHHLLHWFELLSLLGHLTHAAKMIPSIITWCQKHGPSIGEKDASIEVRFSDALRLLLASQIPLTNQALHVYSGTLTTMPQCSLVDLIVAEPNAPRLISARPPGWSAGQMVLEGHSAQVESVNFSPDGQHIVSGSWDMTVRLWDALTGVQIAKFEGHTGKVYSVAFSPDGTRIVSGSADGSIRLWDSRTGLECARLEGYNDWVWSLAFSSDGTQIVSGSGDQTVRLWDAGSTLQIMKFKGHSSPVLSVALSPNGTRIVSGADDDIIRLWDTQTGPQCATLRTDIACVWSVAFSSDGTQIVSGSADKVIHVWDAQTGLQKLKIEGHDSMVMSVAFSPDDAQILSCSSDKTVRLWDAHTGSQRTKFEGHSNWVFSAMFAADGTRIVSGSSDNTLWVWDAHAINGTHTTLPLDGIQSVSDEDCSPLSQASIEDRAHRLWVRSVAFSPDGTQIVSGSGDSIRLWDARTGIQIGIILAHGDWLFSVTFSSDGKSITAQYWGGTTLSWVIADLPCEPSSFTQSDLQSLDMKAGTRCLQETDWIMWQFSSSGRTLDLCWLPVELRGIAAAVHENTIAVGSKTGRMTIIDFTGTLAALRRLGVIEEGEGVIVADHASRSPASD